jgi:hypothetical protein
MNSETKWSLADVRKKIENLEARLLKAKRFEIAGTRSNDELHNKRDNNESKSSIISHSPIKKHQQVYLSLARKFITFSNSV